MPATLPADCFSAAHDFVLGRGRPLDAALLRLTLGEGGPDAVLEALAPFQNADGGFGHGLEPDLRTPASTAIATSVGLRVLVRAAAPAGHPMVRAAISWAAANIDSADGVWPIVGPQVGDAPHAPWWNYSDDLAVNWNGFRFNPSAEMLAHLYVWREAVPAEALTAAESGLARTLAEGQLIESAYDLKCAVRLAESGGLPAGLQDGLDALLRRSIAAHDAGDEHASPFDYAPTPRARLADTVSDIEPALAALIEAQQADGGWPLFWDWAFVDAAAWAEAERDWRGQVTRDAIETLLAWGRVERA